MKEGETQGHRGSTERMGECIQKGNREEEEIKVSRETGRCCDSKAYWFLILIRSWLSFEIF